MQILSFILWSLDFVSDQFIDGRRMRVLVVVDDCIGECLALVPDTSISGILGSDSSLFVSCCLSCDRSF
jgi:hypothetical protein